MGRSSAGGLRLTIVAAVALGWAVGPAAVPAHAADGLEGQAYGASVDVASPLGPLAYGPEPIVTLPPDGGLAQDEVLSVDEPGVLSSGIQQVRTEGSGASTPDGSVSSSARVDDLDVLAGLVTAQQVDSDCAAARSGSTGSVTLTDAFAGGVALQGSPAPNTSLAVEGLGTVTLNRQVVSDEPGIGTRIEVTAIFVEVSDPAVGTGEIVIARSLCGVQHASVLTSPPVAVDDDASTPAGTPATIAVLDNDSDPDGDDLQVGGVSDPGNGTVTINDDGTVTYTPDADYTGTDVFTYTACDPSGLCASATVTVSVTPGDTGDGDTGDGDTGDGDTGDGDTGGDGANRGEGNRDDSGDGNDPQSGGGGGPTRRSDQPAPDDPGTDDPGTDDPVAGRPTPPTSRSLARDPVPATTTQLAYTGLRGDGLALAAVALLAAGSALLRLTGPGLSALESAAELPSIPGHGTQRPYPGRPDRGDEGARHRGRRDAAVGGRSDPQRPRGSGALRRRQRRRDAGTADARGEEAHRGGGGLRRRRTRRAGRQGAPGAGDHPPLPARPAV